MENDMDSYENGLIWYWIDNSDQNYSILIKGTASEVLGMDSDTVFRNTVNDRSIVTSENITALLGPLLTLPSKKESTIFNNPKNSYVA